MHNFFGNSARIARASEGPNLAEKSPRTLHELRTKLFRTSNERPAKAPNDNILVNYYKIITKLLQNYYKTITKLLQNYYKTITQLL